MFVLGKNHRILFIERDTNISEGFEIYGLKGLRIFMRKPFILYLCSHLENNVQPNQFQDEKTCFAVYVVMYVGVAGLGSEL